MERGECDVGNNLTDEGAKYIVNFLNGKSKVKLDLLLLNRRGERKECDVENDIAFVIPDLQKALNRRGIRSPKLQEQWL